MADTTQIARPAEPWVPNWLSDCYPGHVFTEQRLQLGLRRDGVYAIHRFDAVSEDRSIVANIKCHSWTTRGGNHPDAKSAKIYQDVYFLSLMSAPTTLLILTNEEAYRGFLRQSDGKIAEGVQIVHCPLPLEIEKQVAEVSRRASAEQRARSRR